MRGLFEDIRCALRLLARNPGFAVVAVLALALGIGANTAIFSVTNAFLLDPWPFREVGRLVTLAQDNPGKGLGGSVSYPDFVDWRRENHVFEEMAAIQYVSFNLTGVDEPERMRGAKVSAGFFTVLGTPPLVGRTFRPDEDAEGTDRVVVLAHGFWQRRFAAQMDIVGRAILLDGEPHTVIGVMPPQFQFPPQIELWRPLALDYARAHRGAHSLGVVARLKPGVGHSTALAELKTIARRNEERYPDTNAGWSVRMESFREALVKRARPALYTLLAAVAAVLLIACANIANLLLVRATARAKEIAIRAALGAGRGRIVRQLLTESVTLAAAGGALGLLLAHWGVRLLVRFTPPQMMPVQSVRVDATVLLFTLAVTILAGIGFGFAPALAAARIDLNTTLKEGGRTSPAHGGRGWLRAALVVSEIGLGLILLAGAGLLLKSFLRLSQVDPGFHPENVLTIALSLPQNKYARPEQRGDFFRAAVERIGALPGVKAAGAVSILPLSRSNTNQSFSIEGRPPLAPGEFIHAAVRFATPGYFEAMRIPLLRGRAFEPRDQGAGQAVAVINDTMARRFWPNEDPVGRRIRLGSQAPWAAIAGVVGNVKHLDLTEQAQAEMYYLHARNPTPGATIAVRTGSDPAQLSAAVRSEIRAIDRDLPVANIRTMERVVADSTAQPRIVTGLVALFAALAALLAAMGLYGVISYSVAQRSHELGVRMALGATRGDMLRLVLGEGMRLTAAGVVLGLAAALALTRLMASLLFGVRATDPWVFGMVTALIALIALGSTLVPALRASRVDPLIALRYE
jgi:putative ABC transport system permease protein